MSEYVVRYIEGIFGKVMVGIFFCLIFLGCAFGYWIYQHVRIVFVP